MVLDALQHHQTPVMRDFLGLGKLVGGGGGRADGESAPDGVFLPVPTSTGVRNPIFNIGPPPTEHRFSVQTKNPDNRCLEGSAETFGLPCPGQWPGMVASNTAGLECNAKPNVTQLTIFYGGHVNVYNNIPADKADAIMQLAAKGESLSSSVPTLSYGIFHPPGFCQPPTGTENVHATAQMVAPILFTADQTTHTQPLECAVPSTPSTATSPQPVVPRALPLARKASLARFLEKRKERMQMMSPYFKKQLLPVAPGEQMLGILQHASLSDLYSQYTTRPVVFRLQEQTGVADRHGI